MSDLPKATRVCLHFEWYPLPPHSLSLFISCIPVSLIFVASSSCSFRFSLSLAPRDRARSPSVKSYLVTARNMLCEPTYLFAFTYRSGAVPRTTEESPSTVETIENTPSRASLDGFRNSLVDAASGRLACL